jgi:imidazolonepropionase-like amidohydrolase
MRLLTLVVSLALAFSSLAQTVVFRDVNVVSMTSPKIAEGQTVIVRDGKIVSVDTRLAKLPEGTTVIDGSGKYLIPGLAEMHGHLPPPNAPKGLLQDVLTMYVANGITTARIMLGHEGQLNLRAWATKGEIFSPHLYVAGPSFNGQSINSPQAAIDRVTAQKKEGWDLLKVHPGLTREAYDAMAKTAKKEGMRFGGHVPETVGLLHAMEKGHETFDHLDGYLEYLGGDRGPIDEKKLASVVKKSKAAGVWVVPTSALWDVLFNGVPLETLRAYPELKYVPQAAVESWSKLYRDRAETLSAEESKTVLGNRTRVLRALHEGGVKILMGTDAPQQFTMPGFALHRELLRMRDAGMSPYEILRTGTVHAGQYFAKSDSFGTIEAGKRADLVLLSANPLSDIQNVSKIDGVMVGGRWFPRSDLDERLASIAKKYPRASP